MLPVAGSGVRSMYDKNDETRPSEDLLRGVRRCLRERSFVPWVVYFITNGWLFLKRTRGGCDRTFIALQFLLPPTRTLPKSISFPLASSELQFISFKFL